MKVKVKGVSCSVSQVHSGMCGADPLKCGVSGMMWEIEET